MLEVKGEIVVQDVAYHRAADAIGRSPIDLVAAYRSGNAAEGAGRRPGDQRQDHRARHDRPDGLLRQAPRGDPAEPRRAPPDPRPRAEDRPAHLRGARRSRRSRTSARPPRRARSASLQGPVERDRAADPRRDRRRLEARPSAPAPQSGRGGDRRRSSRILAAARPARDRARRLVPAEEGDDRRPRPARRDDRPEGR